MCLTRSATPSCSLLIPVESEDAFYHLVSDYLQRENLQALPPSQRKLMTLALRKLLASSSFAIAGALTSIANRMKAQLKADDERNVDLLDHPLVEDLNEDYEALDETAEVWDDEAAAGPMTTENRKAMQAEIVDLEEFTRLALSIDHNAKGKALLMALKTAFEKAAELGAAEKAIYAKWAARHQGTDKITGSRTADMRSALVDYFREECRIMIANQTCRKPEQIKEAFDELQLELNFEINEAMRATRQKLLENFDEEVQAKLKLRDESSRAFLSQFEKSRASSANRLTPANCLPFIGL